MRIRANVARHTAKNFGFASCGAGRLTVAEFLQQWLEAHKAAVRPRTWTRYEEYVRRHAIPAIGQVALSKLTPQRLQQLYADRLQVGLSPSTVHHLHAVLRTALAQAERWELVARNVATLVDPPRLERHEMRTLSPEEARVLLETVRGERLEVLYVLALSTGMRQGELLGLRWRDVNLESGTLQVRQALHATRDGYIFSEPKTHRSRRLIQLGQRAVGALRRHRVAQAAERLRVGSAWKDNDLVFANEIGRPMDPSNLLKRFRRLLEDAGLPRLRFHDLRHTAATLLLGEGVHPKVVSDLLGHAQIGITLDLYSHVTPTMQQAAADALDAVLGA